MNRVWLVRKGVVVPGLIALISISAPFAGAAVDEPPPGPTPAPPTSPPATAPAEGADATNSTTPVQLSPDELESLRADYTAGDLRTREQLSAYFTTLGINVEEVLGISKEVQEEQARVSGIIQVLTHMEFVRTPETILANRAESAGNRAYPNPSIPDPNVIAEWLHRHVVAGDWGDLREFLGAMAPESGREVCAALFTSLAAKDPQLLPEEVLDVAAMMPGELLPGHVSLLAQMLRPSVATHGSSTLMARLRAGAPGFDPAQSQPRRRIVELLESAGLVKEAVEFLPDLEGARRSHDVMVILAHASYKVFQAGQAARGPEADRLEREAFALFAEATRLPEATTEQLREATDRAISLMPRLPRTMVDPWLDEGFAAGPQRMQIIAEVLALRASVLSDSTKAPRERTEAAVSLSHAVERMLARSSQDAAALRIPLRLLAASVAAHMELATSADASSRSYMSSDFEMLLEAAPDKAWLGAIEPSVASRVSRATISTALAAGNTDAALASLRDAALRNPTDAAALSGHLMERWRDHLVVTGNTQMDRSGWYQETTTRARQARQLESLRSLIELMHELGVDAKALAPTAGVFSACHGGSEIYRAADIERVFGPLGGIPPLTACSLAESMRVAILAYWEEHIQPPKPGEKRLPDREILRVVNEGYETSFALIESAKASAPSLWNVDATKASLAYDRLQLNKRLGHIEPAREMEVTATAFLAFSNASDAYAAALARNEQVETPDIFSRWFRAAMGSTDVSSLRAEVLPADGTLGDNQFDLIRAAIQKLPPDTAYRHTQAFAREVVEALPQAPPDVKPRLVQASLRVIADHPSGTPLREIARLHTEVIKDEVHLRLTIDGSDRVELGRPFAVLVSLRFTAEMERSNGGFSMYLNDSYYPQSYGRSFEVRPKADLERSLRQSFSRGFAWQNISFFDESQVSYGVPEQGQDSWLELPLAIVYLVPTDTTVDRLPSTSMNLYFRDSFGVFTGVAHSNAPALLVGPDPSVRPLQQLEVVQTLDARAAGDPESPELVLQVTARGRGVVPDLPALLDGAPGGAQGFRVPEGAVEPGPLVFLPEVEPPPGSTELPEGAIPAVDELRVVRPRTERTWTVRYKRDASSAIGDYTFANITKGVGGTLTNRAYDDNDIATTTRSHWPLGRASVWRRPVVWGIVLAVLAMAGAVAMRRWWVHRIAERTPIPRATVRRRTPIAVIAALKEWRRAAEARSDAGMTDAISADIAAIEQDFFGPSPREGAHEDLDLIIRKWETRVGSGGAQLPVTVGV